MAPLPEELDVGCQGTTVIPDRDITEGEVVALWARDRVRLVNCADLHNAVKEYYSNRDRLVTGQDD